MRPLALASGLTDHIGRFSSSGLREAGTRSRPQRSRGKRVALLLHPSSSPLKSSGGVGEKHRASKAAVTASPAATEGGKSTPKKRHDNSPAGESPAFPFRPAASSPLQGHRPNLTTAHHHPNARPCHSSLGPPLPPLHLPHHLHLRASSLCQQVLGFFYFFIYLSARKTKEGLCQRSSCLGP